MNLNDSLCDRVPGTDKVVITQIWHYDGIIKHVSTGRPGVS